MYVMKEKFLSEHVDFVPSNEDVYEYGDFGA